MRAVNRLELDLKILNRRLKNTNHFSSSDSESDIGEGGGIVECEQPPDSFRKMQ